MVDFRTEKKKKELTLKERQPFTPFANRTEAKNNAMFRRQKRKSTVSGTMKGKPVNTTGGMFKAMANTEAAKQAVKMDTSVYKPTNTTGSPYGDENLAGKGRRGTPKGNIGNVQQITEDTKYGGMQKKGNELKTPKKKAKKKESSPVKHRSQTQMNSARKSMGQGRYNFTK